MVHKKKRNKNITSKRVQTNRKTNPKTVASRRKVSFKAKDKIMKSKKIKKILKWEKKDLCIIK